MPANKADRPVVTGLLQGRAKAVDDRTWRGRLFSEHGPTTAWLKSPRTARQFAVELLCGALARAHGLPMPRLYAVMAEPHFVPGIKAQQAFWMVGIEDTGRHSLNKVISDTDRVRECLLAWNQAPDCAAFDTWIGNADRTSKNLLCAPGGRVEGIIDHGDAIPDWLEVDQAHANELVRILTTDAGDDQVIALRNKMTKATMGYEKTDDQALATAADHGPANGITRSLVAWLRNRVYHMPNLIASVTKDPQQPLH